MGVGCIFMLLAHLLITVVRLFTSYGLSGAGLLGILVGALFYLYSLFEKEFNTKLYQFFWKTIAWGFFLLGKQLNPLALDFSIFPALIVALTIILPACFLSTIIDYYAVISKIDVSANNIFSSISNVIDLPIDIFSDHVIKGSGKIKFTSNIIDWIVKDCVSINNFFDYWCYSLRSSILGYRCEGNFQWLALVVNILASIAFFSLALYYAFGGILEWQLTDDGNGNPIYDSSNAPEIQPRYAAMYVLISVTLSFLFAIIFIISGWKLATEGKANFSLVETIGNIRLSQGEKILINRPSPNKISETNKKSGIELFKKEDFSNAAKKFQASLDNNHNDPESLIYFNNSSIARQNHYTVAVSLPIGLSLDRSEEILRGVAQAQDEINKKNGINNIPLRVIIGKEDNPSDGLKNVADSFAKNSCILGVVGHFSSRATSEAANFYKNERVVAISPTSTATAISELGNNIFRTVISDKIAAQTLSSYILSQTQIRKLAIFSNANNEYSKSIKTEFINAFKNPKGSAITAEFNMSDPKFNVSNAVQNAIDKGSEGIVLFPDSALLPKALEVAKFNEGNAQLSLFGGDSLYGKDVLKQGGNSVLDMVLAVSWHKNIEPNAEFLKVADSLWGADINWRTVMAYDATKALSEAIKKSPKREDMRQALLSQSFKGASGEVKFLPSGDRSVAKAKLVKVINADPSRSSTGYDYKPINQ